MSHNRCKIGVKTKKKKKKKRIHATGFESHRNHLRRRRITITPIRMTGTQRARRRRSSINERLVARARRN